MFLSTRHFPFAGRRFLSVLIASRCGMDIDGKRGGRRLRARGVALMELLLEGRHLLLGAACMPRNVVTTRVFKMGNLARTLPLELFTVLLKARQGLTGRLGCLLKLSF